MLAKKEFPTCVTLEAASSPIENVMQSNPRSNLCSLILQDSSHFFTFYVIQVNRIHNTSYRVFPFQVNKIYFGCLFPYQMEDTIFLCQVYSDCYCFIHHGGLTYSGVFLHKKLSLINTSKPSWYFHRKPTPTTPKPEKGTCNSHLSKYII